MSVPQAILGELAAQESDLLELLERLVMTESHSADSTGVAAVAAAVIEQLEPLGFRFESERPPALGPDDGWLQEVFSPGDPYSTLGATFYGSVSGSLPGRLLLLGDLDTAFPPTDLEALSFRVENGRAYGPGVADMKGGLVCLVAALRVLDRLGLGRPDISVVLAGDEQAGSLGSRPVIERVGLGADWCLCVECARRGGKLMGGRGHIGVGSIEIAGVEAHTGSARDEGANALEALAELVLRFNALSAPHLGTLVTVTIARSGRRRSVVPAHAVATVDIRTRSARAWEGVTTKMAEIAANVAGETGTEVTVRTYAHRPGLAWDETTDVALTAARRVGADLSIDVEAFESSAAGSSAFADPASATLDGLGPVGGGLMTAQEYIEIDSLVPRTALLAGLIHELATASEALPVSEG